MAEVAGKCSEQKASVPEKPSRTLPNTIIPPENLGIKIISQPEHEDDIDIEYTFGPSSKWMNHSPDSTNTVS